MDISLILGILVCFGSVAIGIFIGKGSPMAYIDISSLVIVTGGLIGATLSNTYLKEGVQIFSITLNTVMPKKLPWKDTISLFVELATAARKEGVLFLQNKVEEQKDHLIKTGLQLIVDGADSDVLFFVVGTEIQVQKNKDKLGEEIFTLMGALAPAFGMLGTITGLILLLANLSDYEKLGSGIAQAFITTFYGIVYANFFFNPLSAKAKKINKEKSDFYEMILTGLQSIQEGDNPFIIEEKLKSFCRDILNEEKGKSIKSTEEVNGNLGQKVQPEAS